MAVVQISRIQIRRGQKYSTGIPQLASGELAWAIDSQELFIGNGAVAEGAPAVGNTKILTDKDSILDFIDQYQYAKNVAYIQTGPNANTPVTRSVQAVLDERVSLEDFISDSELAANGGDYSPALQRALDQLFLNVATKALPDSKVDLLIGPGTYKLNSTIYVPSYARITGAGSEKTIFNFTASSGTVFRFINESSTTSSRSVIGSTTYNNQPKYCALTGFTVNTNEPDVQGMQLDAVRDSTFEDLRFTGGYGDSTVFATSIGIGMYALSGFDYGGGVTTQRCQFINCHFKGFAYGVYAKQDISNNIFSECYFNYCQYGIDFGTGADLFSNGQKYGPRFNNIENTYFNVIDRVAINISNGYGNKSANNNFANVGNNGAGNTVSGNLYSVINFANNSNLSVGDHFDRRLDLSNPANPTKYAYAYKPEIAGKVSTDFKETYTVSIGTSTPQSADAIRIPYTTNAGVKIDYVWASTVYTQMKRGTMTVAIDQVHGTVQFVDDYEFIGTLLPASEEEKKLRFTASLSGGCVLIKYTNTNAVDSGTLTYSYSFIS